MRHTCAMQSGPARRMQLMLTYMHESSKKINLLRGDSCDDLFGSSLFSLLYNSLGEFCLWVSASEIASYSLSICNLSSCDILKHWFVIARGL